jgi:hypothetical protein
MKTISGDAESRPSLAWTGGGRPSGLLLRLDLDVLDVGLAAVSPIQPTFVLLRCIMSDARLRRVNKEIAGKYRKYFAEMYLV